ncbi:peptidyl-prolyl cis-trans isomerase [Acidithiobacillus sp.]
MRLAPILLALSLLPATALAANLATVNGQIITEAQLIAANPAAKGNPAVAEETLQTLINRALLLQEAKKEGLERSAGFQQALANEKDNLLINEALAHYLAQHPVSEKETHARYEDLVKTAPKHQFRLREIIVPSYADAEKIITDLKQGRNFSILAADHSQGPNPTLGGELGWLADNQIPAPILAQIRKAKPGEVVGPIPVPEGFAMVQVLGERPASVLPLSTVSTQLEAELRNQKTAEYLQKLRSQAKITLEATAGTRGKKP